MFSISLLFVCVSTLIGHVHGANQCEAFIDLTLIIDSSNSVPENDFEQGKNALLDLVSRLNVGTDKAGVAVLNFASTVSLSANTDVYEFDRTELLQQIAALPRLATNTATGEALALAKTYCENRCRQTARAVPRVFVIFTDGHSNTGRPPIPIANEIRSSPIEGTIFAVGIGNIGADGNQELLGITDDANYIMNINSYLDLARVTNAITEKMCEFPAFVLPDTTVEFAAPSNSSRYYKMRTVKKNAFFEIEFKDQEGQAVVYTSTTSKKPTSYTSKSMTSRSGNNGKKTFTTFVSADAKNFYFSVKGMARMNKSQFIVRVRPL
ncbi:unnamed protein product [Adineta ricciae]|uniref:VWFA domain-containing protein n=1 Tax=Adineta ricciae TaxID=249248 RepID=A0A814IUF6_ADIRI|nr:unnamed protein product [Adineta ricciae]